MTSMNLNVHAFKIISYNFYKTGKHTTVDNIHHILFYKQFGQYFINV